jgi:DNA-binding transcriptional LysR family regulator
VSLTSEGRHFLDIAERWEQLSTEAQVLQEEGDLRLSIGAVQALTGYVLTPLYEFLANNRPGLSLWLESGTGVDLLERVTSGHLHAAFTVFSQEHVDLRARQLATSPMRIAMSPHGSGPAPEGAIVVSSLDPQSEVSMPWGAEYELWRQRANLSRARLQTDSVNTLAPLLMSPGIWAIVPDFMISRLQQVTGCYSLTPYPEPPEQSIFMLTRKSGNLVPSPEVVFLNRAIQTVWPD